MTPTIHRGAPWNISYDWPGEFSRSTLYFIEDLAAARRFWSEVPDWRDILEWPFETQPVYCAGSQVFIYSPKEEP